MKSAENPGPNSLPARPARERALRVHPLAAPLMAAALVRLALLAIALVGGGPAALFRPDTLSYLKPGQALLLHGAYVNDGAPEIFRPPGYPLFLGLTTLAGGPLMTALIQIALSLLSLALVWQIARRVFASGRIALGAAWIFAFEPLSLSYSVLLLSETLFLLLFLLSMERLVAFLQSRHLAAIAAAGIWLAAATFVRPVTYYLPVALALELAITVARVPGLRWKAPALWLIATLPWLALWQLRNRMETGFGGFSSVQAVNLYRYQAVAIVAGLEHRPTLQVQKEFDDRIGFASLSEIEEAERMRSEGMRIVKAHPGEFARGQCFGAAEVALKPGAAELLNLLGFPENAEELDRASLLRSHKLAWRPWQMVTMALLESILVGLYLLAGLALVQKALPHAVRWGFLGIALYFLAANSGVLSRGRFRIPIVALVCVLASAGFEHLRAALLKRVQAKQPENEVAAVTTN